MNAGPRLAVLLFLLTAGCGGVVTWEQLPKESRFKAGRPILVVPELIDVRTEEEATGTLAWTWIPGVITAERQTGRPERDRKLELNPSAEIQEYLRQLAATSRRFAEVTPNRQEVSRAGRVYTLNAEIRTLSVRLTRRGYALGPVAPLFWVLSLPMGQIETNVEIGLEISDSLGRRLWSETLRTTRRRIRGLYFNGNWRKVLIEDLDHGLRREWQRVLPSLRESLP